MILQLLKPLFGLFVAATPSLAPNHLLVTSFTSGSLLDIAPGNTISGSFDLAALGIAPMGVAVGPNGKVYVSDNNGNRVVVLDASGAIVSEIGAGSGLVTPRGLAFGPDGELYVSTAAGIPLYVFNAAGEKVAEYGKSEGVLRAEGLEVGIDGHIFVASQRDDDIYEFDSSGVLVRQIGKDAGLDDPIGIAFGRDGLMYVASENHNEIVVFGPSGDVVGSFGKAEGVEMPIGLTIGPDNRVYVACFDQNLVHVFDVNGAVATSHTTIVVPGNPAFLAFVPFRLPIELDGDLAFTGAFEKHHIETATLVYSPGVGPASIVLKDVDTSTDLATTFSAIQLVFHGQHASVDATTTKRLFMGTQIPRLAMNRGAASLSLRVTTQQGDFGFPTVKKVEGTLERARAGTIFRGDIRLKG